MQLILFAEETQMEEFDSYDKQKLKIAIKHYS